VFCIALADGPTKDAAKAGQAAIFNGFGIRRDGWKC
jgi:hypothetical protein